MRPSFSNLDTNVRRLARHVLRTHRYGLPLRTLAAEVLAAATFEPDAVAVLALAVLKAERERPRVDWRAVFVAKLLASFLLLRCSSPSVRHAARAAHQTDSLRHYVRAMELCAGMEPS